MFITLTNFYPHNSPTVKLNIHYIVSISLEPVSKKTFITTTNDGEPWSVKESPEKIEELINEKLFEMAKLTATAQRV